jgi:hypothetical protein
MKLIQGQPGPRRQMRVPTPIVQWKPDRKPRQRKVKSKVKRRNALRSKGAAVLAGNIYDFLSTSSSTVLV